MRSRSSASLLARAFAAVALLASASALPALAADYPAPVERDWIARDFRFHTGEVMPELRLHVTTVGAPTGEPVLVLHGTAGSAAGLLVPSFAGELFGPGQALDATRYFIIIPDAIGTGKSAKPSDGLRAAFPHYDYGDMVEAQYRVVTEALGVRHLRLVLGNSMGGMHAWLWGERHPQFMDALVPMACQPTEMAGRSWMMRRLLVETIRGDPGWNGGNYTSQPKSLALANVYFGVATSGGSQAWYQAGPTRKQADAVVDARLAAPFGGDGQRHDLAVGVVVRLRRRAGARADRGDAAGHQFRRRRTQSAGAEDHGARDQAGEERPLPAPSGQHRDAWPRHHRPRQIHPAAGRRPAARGAAPADVRPLSVRAAAADTR